ncbi:unnamed protein product, partial [marine sediment metagenome]
WLIKIKDVPREDVQELVIAGAQSEFQRAKAIIIPGTQSEFEKIRALRFMDHIYS